MSTAATLALVALPFAIFYVLAVRAVNARERRIRAGMMPADDADKTTP